MRIKNSSYTNVLQQIGIANRIYFGISDLKSGPFNPDVSSEITPVFPNYWRVSVVKGFSHMSFFHYIPCYSYAQEVSRNVGVRGMPMVIFFWAF